MGAHGTKHYTRRTLCYKDLLPKKIVFSCFLEYELSLWQGKKRHAVSLPYPWGIASKIPVDA